MYGVLERGQKPKTARGRSSFRMTSGYSVDSPRFPLSQPCTTLSPQFIPDPYSIGQVRHFIGSTRVPSRPREDPRVEQWTGGPS